MHGSCDNSGASLEQARLRGKDCSGTLQEFSPMPREGVCIGYVGLRGHVVTRVVDLARHAMALSRGASPRPRARTALAGRRGVGVREEVVDLFEARHPAGRLTQELAAIGKQQPAVAMREEDLRQFRFVGLEFVEGAVGADGAYAERRNARGTCRKSSVALPITSRSAGRSLPPVTQVSIPGLSARTRTASMLFVTTRSGRSEAGLARIPPPWCHSRERRSHRPA